MTTHATVTIIIDNGKVLLQKKTKGRFGEGKWNGPGGKLNPGETPEECAKREVMEETGLRVRDIRLHGTLKHYFGDVDEPAWLVYQYAATDYQGDPKESEEGELRWFPVDQVPYPEMWQDDEHWLPLLLDGKRFEGEFYFNENATQLLDYSIREK